MASTSSPLANKEPVAELVEAKPVATPAKMPPRKPQQTVMRHAPAGTESDPQTSAATPGVETEPAQGNKKTPMSNEELLRKVREAKARSEARNANKVNTVAEHTQAPVPKQPNPVAGTLVMGDDAGEKPSGFDDQLLKKAQEMLKEVNQDREGGRTDSSSGKNTVS